MNLLKFFPIMALAASIAFIACEDSSSAGGMESCQVASQNPLTLETVQQGVSVEIIIDLKNGKIVQTLSAGQEISEQTCKEYSQNNDYEEVYCMGKKLITTSKKSYTQSDFNQIKQGFINECNNAN